MPFKQRTDHELGWGDKELAYMARRMQRPDGTIANVATLYKLMGYEGVVVTAAFKKRLDKITIVKQ